VGSYGASYGTTPYRPAPIAANSGVHYSSSGHASANSHPNSSLNDRDDSVSSISSSYSSYNPTSDKIGEQSSSEFDGFDPMPSGNRICLFLCDSRRKFGLPEIGYTLLFLCFLVSSIVLFV
jgi:hypothetical protein